MAGFTATPKNGAVWITGGSSGIGKSVAYLLADQGFDVFISARSKDKLEAAASNYSGKGTVTALALDATDRQACIDAVEEIISKSGGIAIAMFNAGSFVPTHGLSIGFDDFDHTMGVNFNGVINGMLPCIKVMKEQGFGQLAIVSSVAGYGGLPMNISYGASKGALINMAESLKFDLKSTDIKIQLINPGFIDTPMTEKNEFPMPFLMQVDKAAERIVDGLKTNSFEITFPRRLTWMLKFVNLLPYWAYFPMISAITAGNAEPKKLENSTSN